MVLQGTGDWLMSLLPDDPENTILKRFKKPKTDDDQQTDAAPDPKADFEVRRRGGRWLREIRPRRAQTADRR